MDISDTIIAKSDQLNASDLIGGPITVTITGVKRFDSAEQPIAISYDGDNGKPFKPCKSVRRLLVGMWKKDATKYVGRRLTLYRDPSVKWAGKEEGGIRVSHASHIDGDFKMALRASKAVSAMTTVKPLAAAVTVSEPKPATPSFDWQAYETTVEAMLFDADETLESQWKAMEAERIKARDSDRERAGKIASRVNDKIKELTEAG